MSPPDSASLETLSLAELRDLVGTLVAKVAELGAANVALKAENQALRDEVARLKGLPPRPPSRPSGMEQATGGGAGPGKGGSKRSRRRRGAKRDREAVTALVHDYCRLFDENRPQDVAALFTDDAVVDYGPESDTIVGRDAIGTTIAVGLITEPHHADEIITGGDADLVMIGRELLREPYWALKAQAELGEDPSWPTSYGYAVKRRPK